MAVCSQMDLGAPPRERPSAWAAASWQPSAPFECFDGVLVGAETDVAGGSLAGMTVVVTGALEKPSRNQRNELIERTGRRSSSGVSKKTTLVLAGKAQVASGPRSKI